MSRANLDDFSLCAKAKDSKRISRGMSWRHSSLTILLVLFNLMLTTHASVLILGDNTRPASLQVENLTRAFEATATRLGNVTYNPKNFLGVNCFYLKPETVNLAACQPLFERLVSRGHVYDEQNVPNGWRLQYAYEPCVIVVASPTRGDRRVKISMMDIIIYTTEVLNTCRETSTGGAYTFQGTWRVQVTRNPVEETFGQGNLAMD